MKLTVDLSILQQAVSTMGAESIDFALSNELIPIEPIDKQLNQGVEVNFEDIEFETGLASYQGRQVLLYIKDHSFNNKIYTVLEDGSKGNKFHVADCEMLERMRKKVVLSVMSLQISLMAILLYLVQTIELTNLSKVKRS